MTGDEGDMRQVVLIADAEWTGYTALVPSLPGCISQGKTVDEALVNIKEAIDLYLEDMPADALSADPGVIVTYV